MDPALRKPMAKRPLGFLSSHGGQETHVEQRQMDGHFPIAAKCFNLPPPSNIQQPVNSPQLPLTASSDGALVFPAQQPKCGSSSAGLGHARQQPSSFSHQGVVFPNPGGQALAGQQLPSINERLLHCSLLINQLVEQQQILQALFTTAASFQSAMAAPPSSPSSQSPRLFEVRTSTRPNQAPTSPAEPCGLLRDVTLRAPHQHEHQRGSKTSQAIEKGRKCNNSAEPKQQCVNEPLEVQVWLEHSVESSTSHVNGKQFGSPTQPAAVSVAAATGESQRISKESTRDVTVGNTQLQKIVLASEEPVQHLGSEDVNDEDRCCIADAPASIVDWTTVSTTNQQDQQRPASYAIDAVDLKLDRCNQMSYAMPVGHSERAPSVVVARILFVKINQGLPTSRNIISSHCQQHTPSQDKCEDIYDDCLQLFVDQRRRWLVPGEVEAFANQPPPWPPPAEIIVLLLTVEPMPDPSRIQHAVQRKKHLPNHRPSTCLRR